MISRMRQPFPIWVGLIIGAYLALAIIYATVTPLFEKPDENWHFGVAMYLLEHGTLPQNKPDAPLHYAQQQANQAPFYYLTLSPVLRLMGYQELTTGFQDLIKRNEGVRTGYNLLPNDNYRFFIQGRCEGACAETASAVYVGRGLSALYVGVGLLFIALTMRRVFPTYPTLALLTTALVAFNPQVLHIASSVSNDGLTILLMSMGFYGVAQWLDGKQGVRQIIFMGVVAGLALLTKVSAGALGLMIGLLLLWRSHQRVRDLIVLGISSGLMCGWWIVYNLIHYGELTGIDTHLAHASFPTGGKIPLRVDDPIALSDFSQYFRRIVSSFWGEFGWGNITMPDQAMDLTIIFLIVSLLIGSGVILWRVRQWSVMQRGFILFLLGTTAVIGVSFINWMMTIEAPHGRLLFPAIFPLAMVMGWGLIGWIPSRWRGGVAGVMGVVLFLQALWMPFQFIQPAYAVRPPEVAPVIGETIASFHETDGGTITLSDVVIIPQQGRANIQLTWQAEQPFQHDYLVFVHLLDEEGAIIGQRDSYPMLSNYPFTLLNPAETLDDIYPIDLYSDAPITAIRVGIYYYGAIPNTWHRLSAQSQAHDVQDDALVIPLDVVRVIHQDS